MSDQNATATASDCAPSSSKISESGGSMDEELLTQANQAMQNGKRHLFVNDYQSAVSCFELASEILGHCYGIQSLKCADAYLYYGISLYEMSRLEEGLDGGIVNVEKKDSDDEEDEGEEEQGEEEQGEEKAAESEEENESEEDTAKDEDEENLKSSETETTKTECNDMTNEQPSTSKSEPGSSNATNAENGEKNEEDEDDRTNIEIAYEVLITAKNIYSEHLHEKEVRINYAEALQKLGEISIDWENLDGAIEYLNECLKHRREVLEPDDRLIAFTYHYLGLAYSFKHECDLSNKCFQSALDVIHLRIDNLKTKQKAGFDPMEKGILENEIEQLESLVPEIQAKIEDVKEQISSHFKAMAALAKETKEEEMRKFQTDFQPKPVTVINHLIKRKREDNDDNTTTTNGNAVGNKDSNLLKKICITTISDTTTKTTINDSSPTSTTSATMPVTSSSKLASSNSDVANEPATATTTTPQP